MRLVLTILSCIAVLDPASAQNPPTNYTAQSTPYDDTTAWYCEVVTGTLNKQCTFLGLRQSLVTLPNLTSASLLTTTGVITSGGLGTGASINFGGLTYNGTNGIPLNQLPSSLATLPLAINQGGTGTTTPALVAGNGISITNAWPNQTITAAIGAQTTNTSVGNPAGTTSLTGVMAGIGAGCSITPTKTGNVTFSIGGTATNNTASDGFSMQMRYGTGSAPANAAAPTGNVISNVPFASFTTTTQSIPISVTGVANGLTLSTAVWFDIREAAITGGTASISNITCSAMEQ